MIADTHATGPVKQFIARLKKTFPAIPIETADERYTSKMATRAMIDMGMKKKDRRNKALVDEIAATMMLQEYLEGKTQSDRPGLTAWGHNTRDRAFIHWRSEPEDPVQTGR